MSWNWFDFLIMTGAFGSVAVIYYFLTRMNADGTKKKRDAKNISNAAGSALAATKRFAAMQHFEVIAPAHLAKNGKFADLDFILVGCFGLLCVKCVGLGGEIYGSASDAKWLQVTGGERIPFDNPIQQAAADTRLVRDALFTAKMKNVNVETVCVFTNRKAQLSLPRSTGHYTLKDYRALLGKDRLRAEKNVDIAKAAAAVRAYLAPAQDE